jgi:SAM-dependent methyltransferase
MELDDPDLVRSEYASEHGLAIRSAVYRQGASGPDAAEAVLAAVGAAEPRRVLEVGCGPGELSARMAAELGAEVVALDLSPRMVELARSRGVDARLGDVQDLPFADGIFDVAVAAWMLYHAPDLDRALLELRRVLAPGGRLVAATNAHDHLVELWALVGRDRPGEPPRFRGDNAEQVLTRHFARVGRVDCEGTALFRDADAVRRYVAASIRHGELASRVPELEQPLVATRHVVVLTAWP